MGDYWNRYYGSGRPQPKVKKSGRGYPIVLLGFDGFEITPREVIFSIALIGVMFFLGFLISERIESRVNANTLKYRQASVLNSDSEFQHALNTDIGFAFARGRLDSVKPVSNKHVPGGYLSVRVNHQRYQMHTQVYTTTDSKGRVHTHVRHYWTWDTVSTKFEHSPIVRYCGVEFPYGKFDYGGIPEETSIHNTGHNKRDVVSIMRDGFDATTFSEFKDNGIANTPELSLKGIVEYRNSLVSSHSMLMFWVLWSVVSLSALIAFYMAENQWLEDSN